MSTAAVTVNGSEVVTKGNYHTLATRVLTDDELVLDGSMITIGSDSSTVKLNGDVSLPGFDADTFEVLKDSAFVAETGSSYGSSTAWKLVDERCHAVIQEGRLVDVREFSTYDTSMPLVEGAVLHVDATGNVDLSAVTCKRFATSYIWIDIPSSVSAAPQIAWPGTVTNSVWLETEAPSTLDVGKRHVIVFLNDGTDDQAHYVFNYAYSYAL